MLERSGTLRPRQGPTSPCVNQSNHAGALAKTRFNFSVSSAPGRSGRKYLRKYCATRQLRGPSFVKRAFVAELSTNIWMLFTACFPCRRFKAPTTCIDQWFTNPRIAIEDQKSELSRDDGGTLEKACLPFLLARPTLLLDVGQRTFFQTRELAHSGPLILRHHRLSSLPARPVFSPRRPYRSPACRHRSS